MAKDNNLRTHNMYKDILTHFVHNVATRMAECEKNRESSSFKNLLDLRTLIGLATSLYHYHEFVKKANCDTATKQFFSRSHLMVNCQYFDIVRDITNASKHSHITNYPAKMSTAEQMFETITVVEYSDENGPYFDNYKSVYLRLDDNTVLDMFIVVATVFNYHVSTLTRIGLPANITQVDLTENANPKSRSECALNDLEIGIYKYMPNFPSFSLRKYNYEKKCIEIMPDINKDEYIVTVGTRTIPFFLKNLKTEIEYEYELTLDDKNYLKAHMLSNKDEREVFLKELAMTHLRSGDTQALKFIRQC